MVEVVRGFLVYHAALREQTMAEHFNFPHGKHVSNLVSSDGKDFEKNVIQLFSHRDDWVLDMNSERG